MRLGLYLPLCLPLWPPHFSRSKRQSTRTKISGGRWNSWEYSWESSCLAQSSWQQLSGCGKNMWKPCAITWDRDIAFSAACTICMRHAWPPYIYIYIYIYTYIYIYIYKSCPKIWICIVCQQNWESNLDKQNQRSTSNGKHINTLLIGWRSTLPGLLRRASRHFSASTGSHRFTIYIETSWDILLFKVLAFGIWCYRWNRTVVFECRIVFKPCRRIISLACAGPLATPVPLHQTVKRADCASTRFNLASTWLQLGFKHQTWSR